MLNKDQGNTYKPLSYVHMYPQYFYPERYTAGVGYNRSYLLESPEKSFFGGGLDDLMLKRSKIIDSKIHLLLSDIYQRREFQKEHIYRIYLDQCNCRNLIFQLDEEIWDRKRMDIERKIIDLEQEKRMEQTSYFRDILFLKKDLREALIEKLEEKQKTDMLLNHGVESTCST